MMARQRANIPIEGIEELDATGNWFTTNIHLTLYFHHFLPELALEPPAECPGMFLLPKGLPGVTVVAIEGVQRRGVKK